MLCSNQCAVDPILHHPGYAITGKRRVPNVPTSSEAGVPGFDVTTWYGMYTPAQHAETDRGCARCRSAKGAQDPALINRFAEVSMKPVEEERATSAALERLLKAEIDKWDRIIKGDSARSIMSMRRLCSQVSLQGIWRIQNTAAHDQEVRRVGTAIQLFAISVLDVWV
jgi:hypothetical protein